jgi:hypothetical protein
VNGGKEKEEKAVEIMENGIKLARGYQLVSR